LETANSEMKLGIGILYYLTVVFFEHCSFFSSKAL